MMTPAPLALPDRPLVVRPPGVGLVGFAWIAALVVGCALYAVMPVGDLVTDLALAGKAIPVPGAGAEGSCSIGTLVTTCDLTLTAPRGAGPARSRKVRYLFAEGGVTHHTFRVLADPARPALLTTDLAQDRLWNRVISLVASAVLALFVTVIVLQWLGRTIRLQRATVRALSRQALRLVMLRMDDYALGTWTVVTPESARRVWLVGKRARPIVMDPGRRLVLGITAGDGRYAMPLDRDLRWLGLDARERRALRDALGRDRLGGWLAALDTPARAGERRRLRRFARGLLWVGLLFVPITAGAIWWLTGRLTGGDILILVPAMSGAIALGMLLGAACVHVKYARRAAILR